MKKLKFYRAAVLGLLWIIAMTNIYPVESDAVRKVNLIATIFVYGCGLLAMGGKE